MESYSKALATLAFLEVASENGIAFDRLDVFLPLVESSLCQRADAFTIEEFQQQLVDDHGLQVPQPVLKALLSRCSKKGYLVQRNGTYERTDRVPPNSFLLSRQEGIFNDQQRLLKELAAFARDRGIDLAEEEIPRRLFRYLQMNFGALADDGIRSDALSQESRDKWIDKFFLNARDESPWALDTAITLMNGLVIYDVAFCQGFVGGFKSFKNLIVYFDSPILCDLLDMSREEKSNYARECVAILENAGVVCRAYENTISEVKGILHAVYQNWGKRGMMGDVMFTP